MHNIKFILLTSFVLSTFGALAQQQESGDKKEKSAPIGTEESMVRAWCDAVTRDFSSCQDLTPPVDCKAGNYRDIGKKLQECIKPNVNKVEPHIDPFVGPNGDVDDCEKLKDDAGKMNAAVLNAVSNKFDSECVTNLVDNTKEKRDKFFKNAERYFKYISIDVDCNIPHTPASLEDVRAGLARMASDIKAFQQVGCEGLTENIDITPLAAGKYTIKFDANGGTGAPLSDMVCEVEKNCALPKMAFTKSGYEAMPVGGEKTWLKEKVYDLTGLTVSGGRTYLNNRVVGYEGGSIFKNFATAGSSIVLYPAWRICAVGTYYSGGKCNLCRSGTTTTGEGDTICLPCKKPDHMASWKESTYDPVKNRVNNTCVIGTCENGYVVSSDGTRCDRAATPKPGKITVGGGNKTIQCVEISESAANARREKLLAAVSGNISTVTREGMSYVVKISGATAEQAATVNASDAGNGCGLMVDLNNPQDMKDAADAIDRQRKKELAAMRSFPLGSNGLYNLSVNLGNEVIIERSQVVEYCISNFPASKKNGKYEMYNIPLDDMAKAAGCLGKLGVGGVTCRANPNPANPNVWDIVDCYTGKFGNGRTPSGSM